MFAPPRAKPDRCRGKLVRMITDASSKFDDYSISPKIKQILLHWNYELTEKYFSFIRQIMQTVKQRYSKEKATEY